VTRKMRDYHRLLGPRNDLVYRMKQGLFTIMAVLVAVLWAAPFAFGGNMQTEDRFLKLSVVFNNVPFNTHLRTSWGFSCLVEGTEQTILFDTGGEGSIYSTIPTFSRTAG